MTDLTVQATAQVVAPTWKSETKSGNAIKRVLRSINTPGVKLLRTIFAAGMNKSAITQWFLFGVGAAFACPLVILDILIFIGYAMVAGLLALAYSNEKSRAAGPFVAKYGFVFPIVIPVMVLTFLLTMILVPIRTVTQIKTVTNTITASDERAIAPATGEEGAANPK